MGEIKQTNFRIDSETADAFRAFCEEKGMNQAQGFDHVMQVFELNQAKTAIQGRCVEIEEFETSVKAILSAYLNSLEINQNAEMRVREQFSSELTRKDARIAELQKKVEELQAEKKKTDAEKAEKTKQEQSLTEQFEMAKKSAADQEQINTMLHEKLTEATNNLKQYTALKQSESALKEELTQAKQELHETTLAFSHARKEHETNLTELKETNIRCHSLEKSNAELQQQISLLKQELSEQKAQAENVLQQAKSQAELTLERALIKKEREMQELLRQADKETVRLEVMLEQVQAQLAAEKEQDSERKQQ